MEIVSQESARSLRSSQVSVEKRRPRGLKKVSLRPYERNDDAQLSPQASALEKTTSEEVAVGSSSTDQDAETPRFTRRETLLTMAGVLLVMLLASLDQTSTVY
jgi:hypothetical protein